jgi:acyl-ACP thioesterase
VREFRSARKVRLGDVTASGRLRLDALARYLQDVASDDGVDAGLTGGRWVVRRIELQLTRLPGFEDEVELVTSCSGVGSRWAQRRTVMSGPRADVDSNTIWVHLDERGRPAPLDPRFPSIWGEGLPHVSARLTLPAAPAGIEARPWPLRISDVDVLGHVNNAIALVAVEEELVRHFPGRRLTLLEAEYRDPLDPDDDVELASSVTVDELSVFLFSGEARQFSARVRASPR